MPLRSYHSRSPEPTALDHTLAHEYEVVFGSYQIVAAVLGLIAVVTQGFSVSLSFDRLSAWFVAALCVFLIVGGIFTLAGIYNNDDRDLMVGYKRERTGLILSVTAWLLYSVVVAFAFPSSILGWAFGIVPVSGGCLRLWATYREEHRLREGA
jgi:TctA family transporter